MRYSRTDWCAKRKISCSESKTTKFRQSRRMSSLGDDSKMNSGSSSESEEVSSSGI